MNHFTAGAEFIRRDRDAWNAKARAEREAWEAHLRGALQRPTLVTNDRRPAPMGRVAW